MTYSIEVKVVPSSGKSLITSDELGRIKCYLKSQPERGAANKELIKLIANQLDITQNAVAIIMGETERKKVLKITIDCSKQEMLQRLGVNKQLLLF